MKEPSDEDINKRIAEFDGREILGEYNVFYKYRDKGSVYIKLMSKTFYTSSLDSLIPVVDQVLFKLEISVWVEPRLGISGVVFNSWTKRIGGYYVESVM